MTSSCGYYSILSQSEHQIWCLQQMQPFIRFNSSQMYASFFSISFFCLLFSFLRSFLESNYFVEEMRLFMVFRKAYALSIQASQEFISGSSSEFFLFLCLLSPTWRLILRNSSSTTNYLFYFWLFLIFFITTPKFSRQIMRCSLEIL